MTDMPAYTKTTATIAVCPACQKDLVAEVQVHLNIGPMVRAGDGAQVQMTGEVSGLRLTHDCMPKATR